MKRLVRLLLVLAVLFVVGGFAETEAALVIIGMEPKSRPPELHRCETLTAGKVELGVDPTGAAKNAAFNALVDTADLSTLLFTMDDSAVPGNICISVNAGDTYAVDLCALKGLSATGRNVATAGDEDWYVFRCTPDNRAQTRSVWVVVECP